MKQLAYRLLQQFKNLNSLEKGLIIFLMIMQVYYSYRYALRFGSPLSPPGYVLTPLVFQVGKYVLVGMFYLVGVFFVLRGNTFKKIFLEFKSNAIWLLTIIFLAYLVISLFKFDIEFTDFGISQTIKMVFVIPIVFLLPFLLRIKESFNFWKLFLLFSLAFHASYEILMILLFFLTKRLPGLTFSYILPRFGGGWDDPNSFAAFGVLIFTVLVVFNFGKGLLINSLHSILLAVVVILILYGYSITAFLGLVTACFLLLIFRRLSIVHIVVVGLSSLLFGLVHYFLNLINLLVEAKLASSSVHLASEPVNAQKTSAISILKPVFEVSSKPTFNENFYLQMYQNYDLIALGLFVFILLLTIMMAYRGWRHSKKSFEKKFFLVSLVYLVSFSFMNLGIPFFQIFPLNLFVWVMMGGVWLMYQRNKIETFKFFALRF